MKISLRAVVIFNFLFLFCSQIIQAQLFKSWGLKVGINSSGVSIQPKIFDTNRRTGISAGIFAELINSPYFSFITGVDYLQRGFIEEMAEMNNNGDFIQQIEANTRLDYISIPFCAKIQMPLDGVTPYIVAGPRIDFLINRSKGVFRFSSATINSELASNYSSQDVGGTIGFGIETDQLLALPVLLEVRYGFDIASSFEATALEAYNNAVDIVLGIKFK